MEWVAGAFGECATHEVAGSPVFHWLLFALATLAVAAVTQMFQAIVVRRARAAADSTRTKLDDLVVEVARAPGGFFHLASGLLTTHLIRRRISVGFVEGKT